jgi:hypothetical protein
MHRFRIFLFFGLIATLFAQSLPASAERPLLDYHKLDAYFTLFAHDSNVPWEPATVRLDTATDAPVDFTVYAAQPADVISAGSNTLPRAIDTRRLHPIASWRYTPPGGYRFQSNDVEVPLGSREGFFVVEARRAGVGEQVWINRTRIGLLTKETPAGISVYATDLGSGSPLAHMRVSFIVNRRFVDRDTGSDGVVSWHGGPRPVFALAQWGASFAFVSFLPQAPLPKAILGIKTATAVVHAGDDLRMAGFARSRSGGRFRPASGDVLVSLRSAYGVVARQSVRLDAAGAFSATLHVPENSAAGEYTALATADGAAAGTAISVDADAGGLSLTLHPQCDGLACNPGEDVPVTIEARRDGVAAAGVDVDVNVIRSPHLWNADAGSPWGIAQWYRTSVRTASDGRAIVEIPHPSDGLSSTYGVRASSGGATADTRVRVPTASIALHVATENADIGSGTPAVFDVWVTRADTGAAVGGVPVTVQLLHGTSVQQQVLTSDDSGRVHGAFSSPEAGSNLILASLNDGGARAMDAVGLQVEPQTLEVAAANDQNVAIELDRSRYAGGQDVRVTATLPGSQGFALMTLESAERTQLRVVRVQDGRAAATFRAPEGPGALAAGAAFVRNGTLQWSSVPLSVDAPGCPLTGTLALDKSRYDPGAVAMATLGGVAPGGGTVFVRVSKGAPTGSAVFSTAPDLLSVGATATQDSAVGDESWHPWVDSTGNHALAQTFARRSAPPQDLTIAQADTAATYWNVARAAGQTLSLPVPQSPGRYVISLLKIADDGRVIAASTELVVQ